MAIGVVPICLDSRSGIREAIEHGLVVKDRADDFLAAVGHLQSDPAKWRQLSLAARETVLQRYSIEEGARQWIDLLEHLNKQKAGSGDFRARGCCGCRGRIRNLVAGATVGKQGKRLHQIRAASLSNGQSDGLGSA
jgi:Glycosyl transferases group 1